MDKPYIPQDDESEAARARPDEDTDILYMTDEDIRMHSMWDFNLGSMKANE